MDLAKWRERLIGSAAGGALTPSRIRAAYAVAIATDVLQFALGPLGWTFFDEIFDVIALVATTGLLGFHPLLLPTFILEVVPVVDMLPTWTGCVALVVALRRRRERHMTHGEDEAVTIDVKPTSVH